MPAQEAIPPRLRRTLELVYGVEGVVAARVWLWTENKGADEKVAVAIRPTAYAAAPDVLRRVEAAVAAIKQPGETWDFGILDDS